MWSDTSRAGNAGGELASGLANYTAGIGDHRVQNIAAGWNTRIQNGEIPGIWIVRMSFRRDIGFSGVG